MLFYSKKGYHILQLKLKSTIWIAFGGFKHHNMLMYIYLDMLNITFKRDYKDSFNRVLDDKCDIQ